MIAQTTIVENVVPVVETEQPEPIRIIRKVNGVHEWVDVLPSDLTDAECRAIYVAAFSPCGVA